MFSVLKQILKRKGWILSDAQKLFVALPKIARMHKDGTMKIMPKVKPIEADAKIYCRDVLPLDQVCRNGHRYSVEAMQSAIDSLGGEPLNCWIGFPHYDFPMVIGEPVGTAKLQIENGRMVSEITVRNAELLSKFAMDGLDKGYLSPVAMMICGKQENKDVEDFNIKGIAIIDTAHAVI